MFWRKFVLAMKSYEGSPEILAEVPIVDLPFLKQDDHLRSLVIEKIFDACSRYGYFQVTNHGIADSVIAEAVDVNFKFFEREWKQKKSSHQMIYTELLDLVKYRLRNFPGNSSSSMPIPSISSLIFGPDFLQITGAAKTGLPTHTDHSIITVLLQSAAGLRVIHGGSWKNVPEAKGSLMVLVGNHLEVISNGVFKSVLHEAIPRCSDGMRVSVASLHSLGMDDSVEPASELLCDGNPGMYKGSSLRDFLGHLESGDKRPFIQTLKK